MPQDSLKPPQLVSCQPYQCYDRPVMPSSIIDLYIYVVMVLNPDCPLAHPYHSLISYQ
jgi:hypothetical protein